MRHPIPRLAGFMVAVVLATGALSGCVVTYHGDPGTDWVDVSALYLVDGRQRGWQVVQSELTTFRPATTYSLMAGLDDRNSAADANRLDARSVDFTLTVLQELGPGQVWALQAGSGSNDSAEAMSVAAFHTEATASCRSFQ